jgi:hypothetical protein
MGVTYLMGGDPLQVLLNADPSQLQINTPADTTEYEGNDPYEVFVRQFSVQPTPSGMHNLPQ